MSDHTTALVPIDTWSYMSPELRHRGIDVDMGLFAESLIYYDRIFIALPRNEHVFHEFMSWLDKHNAFNDFIALIKDGTIKLYYYSFYAAPVNDHGVFTLMNIQEKRAAEDMIFDKECLSSENLKQIFPHSRQRSKLSRALRENVIEVKAKDFEAAIENAKQDYHDKNRCELLMQALLDDVYPTILKSRKIPTITARVIEKPDGKTDIEWNINFSELGYKLGKNIGFDLGMPLAGAAICNRLLWSAAQQGCDLYLPSPMSALAGDKLYETDKSLARVGQITDQLVAEVEFPDIRRLVNDGHMKWSDVLLFRGNGSRFRQWLQDESERDRNALIAYHTEVAKASGWISSHRKTLRLFGTLSSLIVGAAAAHVVEALVPSGAEIEIGSIAGGAVKASYDYVLDLATRRDADWHPIVFGNWARDRIRKRLADKSTST